MRPASPVMMLVCATVLCIGSAQAQPSAKPSVGSVQSPPDAMIFYVARGPAGACGRNCSEWISAEGRIYWDTSKRLLALLGRLNGRKLPVIVNVSGESDLIVATTMGRVFRERGLDVSIGRTVPDANVCAGEAACLALKRAGSPVNATIDRSSPRCDLACVLMLAGGVRRSLPPTTRVLISGTMVGNRLGLKVSEERRAGLQSRYNEQYRRYFTDMGVDLELLDLISRQPPSSAMELPPKDWVRLRLVNAPEL